MRFPASPLWAASLPALALAAGLGRWLLQGSGNLYTAWTRRYYLPDELLGWRVVHDGPVWLGLEVLAVVAATAVGVGLAAWWLRRRERRGKAVGTRLLAGLWLVAALPLAMPIWAFASGTSPSEARDRLPITEGVALEAAPTGVSGRLAGAPSGRYRVVAGEGSAITARLKAGGESFDARFAGGIEGALTIDTASVQRGIAASVRVDAASVDTGVTGRSKSARDYLKVTDFPTLGFTLDELLAARQGKTADAVEFWARGTIDMMGQKIPITVRGRARALDAGGRSRFQLNGPGLLITGDFSIALPDTPLAGDAGDFDTNDVPINATLVLVRDEPRPTGADS